MLYLYYFGSFLPDVLVVIIFAVTAINLIYILYELEKIHHIIFDPKESVDTYALLDEEKKKSLDHLKKIKKLYAQGDQDDLLAYIEKSQREYYDEVDLDFDVEILNIILQRYIHICRTEGINLTYDIQSNVKALLEAASFSGEQLCTVLGNLMDNAIDAMKTYSKEKEIKISIVGNGHQVLVAVQNTGTKIPEETMDKLFNYGFSTKSGSRGAGLFIVYKLVEKLGASIGVESNNKFTRFKVVFNLS